MYCTVTEKRGAIFSYLCWQNLKIYCVHWIWTNILPIWNKKIKVKIWTDLNQHPSELHSNLLPLSYKWLCYVLCFQLYRICSPETTLVKLLVWFWSYSTFIFMSVWQVCVAEWLELQTAGVKVAGSNLHINFCVTPRWLLVQ